MKLERALNQNVYWYFVLFFVFVLAAFWVTYFTNIFGQENYRMHFHGITLILWCLMLAVQPYLIKTKRLTFHRAVGKASYLLVPVLLYTTMDLMIYRIKSQPVIDYAFVALVFNALVAFIIFYGLAIYLRKKPPLHSRFMISTVFPFFTPVTDRIISIYFPSALKYLPTINGLPNVPLVGFVLADLLVIGLCIWDWRSHRRLTVFPFVLLILLVYHFSFNFFYRYDFWKSFCEWMIS